MDIKSLLQSMTKLSESEGSRVHKGTYGTSHGKEDVRDQYGHKIGKVNKDAEGKKEAPKKGRGRPKKGSDASGEVKSYDTSTLGSVFGGGKKPSKEVGKKSVKHSLKEYIDEAEIAINEDMGAMGSQDAVQIKPASQTNTQVIQQGTKTLGTVSNPQLANQIKQSLGKGEMTLSTDDQAMQEDEHFVNEKAKSKAQQRFFGMVHAMQKGKKVPGASKELKGVAKDIGKQDAEDFARTKHKGLPQHVKKANETSFEDQGVVEGEEKKTMSRAAKGHEKYGKEGMQALAKAGRDGAGEKKLDTIRDKYDRYDKDVSEAKDLPGKQDKLDVAPPKGKLTKADFAALRSKKKVSESIVLEGAMKDLLINFHSDVHSHMGDGSMFDLKKATNVQQAEEVLKALVKHGDEYDGLDSASQNELVNQALKYLAHEKELPFNTLAGVDKQRFATRTPADLSKFRQNPATPATSSFSKPGGSMATPRTTGSNGFLKTLNTPTFNEGNNMKDKQFESWERELNSLLTEGITVSTSTGQQGAPDSVSINATEHDASELMSILRNSGLGVFGGGEQQQASGYGAPIQGDEEGGEEFHQGTDIAPSPEVVGDGSDMLELIKKMSGIGTDANTPGSVEVDYEDEEGSGEEGGEEFGGEESYDDEEDSGEEGSEEQDSGEESDDEEEVDEAMYDEGYEETDEGNMFTGNLAKARAQGKEEADLDGDGDMEKVQEGEEDCMECGYPMESCGCEQVEEGFSNDAGGDAMGDTELLNLRELLGRGNDLHRQKHTQATGNIQKVTMETKLLKDTTSLLTDWQRLSGIK